MQRAFYGALKFYCWLALHFYFRKWQVHKAEPIPAGPVIFVANHQNAFLDAVLVICSTSRNPWALARANVFKKKWASRALTFIQMLPVYRFRDGFDTLRKNEAIIESCADLLAKQKSILIFGEGNHNDRYTLLPLQKGFARIAQAATVHNVALKIVPVAFYYEAHRTFRSRVLVNFGKSIEVPATYFAENAPAKTEALMAEVRAALLPLTLIIPEGDYSTRYQSLHGKFFHSDLVQQLASDQRVVNQPHLNPGIRKNSVGILQQVLRVYYTVNHVVPLFIIHKIINQPRLDPQFIASLKFAVGMVLTPLAYLLQSFLVGWLSDNRWFALYYLISLPVSVIFLHPKKG